MQSYATYDDYNNLLTYRQPGRPASDKYTLEYGATAEEKKKHLLVKSTSPLDIQHTYAYDNKGNVLTKQTQNSTASAFIKGEITYTADQNYVATQADARGKVVTSNIDPATSTLTSVQDPNGQTVNYAYDIMKRITDVHTTADGKTYKNAYSYANDKLMQVSHNTDSDTACDVQYNFAYDAAGRPTTVKVGSQQLSENVYNPDGTLQKIVYGNTSSDSPMEMRYSYDEYKRLKGVQYDFHDEDAFLYEYGANGQVAQVTDNFQHCVTKSEYDASNRPMRITHMMNTTHLYTGEVEYDEYNNLKTFKEKVGSNRTAYQTNFTYDKENKPTLMTFGDANNKVSYVYDALGRISSRTLAVGGTGTTITYNYVDGGYGPGSTTPLVESIAQSNNESCSYTYDDNGNIIAAVRGTQTVTYVYDKIGQLIRVNDPLEGATWVYNYDRGGNITSKVRYAYTTGTLGTALQTIPYGYDPVWKDKLTSYNGQSITHDAIGNPIYDGTWHYQWEQGRRMWQMYKGADEQPGSVFVDFTYNANGLRTSKEVLRYDDDGNFSFVTTQYTLHGNNVVHMTQGNNNLHFWYDAQNRPAIVEFNGLKYGYILNLQGDVVGLMDSTGTEVVRYTYDAWGKLLRTTGTMFSSLGYFNPFRYRGYIYDEETGMYYLRSRYYNPEFGRFINADAYSVPAQFCETLTNKNLYAYCNNNPIYQVDSSGLFGLFAGMVVGFCVGFFVGGIVSAVSQYINEGEVEWYVALVDAASGAIGGAIAATPIGLGASVAVNSALGAATYMAEQGVKGEEITALGLVAGTAGGAVSGLIGGSGADAGNLGQAWESTAKSIAREQRRANVEYAAKQIARYTSERILIKKTIATAIVRFTAGTVGSAVVNQEIQQVAIFD